MGDSIWLHVLHDTAWSDRFIAPTDTAWLPSLPAVALYGAADLKQMATDFTSAVVSAATDVQGSQSSGAAGAKKAASDAANQALAVQGQAMLFSQPIQGAGHNFTQAFGTHLATGIDPNIPQDMDASEETISCSMTLPHANQYVAAHPSQGALLAFVTDTTVGPRLNQLALDSNATDRTDSLLDEFRKRATRQLSTDSVAWRSQFSVASLDKLDKTIRPYLRQVEIFTARYPIGSLQALDTTLQKALDTLATCDTKNVANYEKALAASRATHELASVPIYPLVKAEVSECLANLSLEVDSQAHAKDRVAHRNSTQHQIADELLQHRASRFDSRAFHALHACRTPDARPQG